MVRPGLQRTGRLVLSDQIATLPVVLLPDPVGTEGLQDHPAGVPVVVRRGVQSLDHREDLAEVPLAAVLLPDPVGTEGLQDHPAGDPVVVPLGVQRLGHREDQVVEVEVHQEDQAGAVVPLGN